MNNKYSLVLFSSLLFSSLLFSSLLFSSLFFSFLFFSFLFFSSYLILLSINNFDLCKKTQKERTYILDGLVYIRNSISLLANTRVYTVRAGVIFQLNKAEVCLFVCYLWELIIVGWGEGGGSFNVGFYGILLKDVAPLFHPIRRKAKPSCNSLVQVSLPSCQLHDISSSFDCFIGLYASFVIGWSYNLGFSSTALN